VRAVLTVAKTARPEAVAPEPAVSRRIELPPPDVQPDQVEALNASPRLAEPQEAAADTAVPSRLPETTAAAVLPGAPDAQLVRQVLERYRLAYEALDARTMRRDADKRAPSPTSARLDSQRITFHDCRVELQGKMADAMCIGTARFVPRFDIREPRVEPRTWNFTLRKVDADWKILTARVSS
jgi:hypothetical protein